MTRIISFDLGSTTGIAEGSSHHLGHIESVRTCPIEMATASDLAKARRTGAIRFLDPRVRKFSIFLEGLRGRETNLLVYEDVQFGRSVAQCQIWGSFRGVLQSFAARHNIPIVSIPTGTLKKWTTKSGAAQKEDMKKAALKRWPSLVKASATHDEIDALALLMWGFEYWYLKRLNLGE